MSDEESKFIAIDEETDHQIVHRRRFGKTHRATHQALDPGPQLDVLALDCLRVLFADGVLLWVDVPLIRSPSIRVKPRDPTRLQQLLQLQKNGVLSAPEDVGSHVPTVRIDGVPSPPRLGFFAHVTPHLIEL
jgi:hypothetical protein